VEVLKRLKEAQGCASVTLLIAGAEAFTPQAAFELSSTAQQTSTVDVADSPGETGREASCERDNDSSEDEYDVVRSNASSEDDYVVLRPITSSEDDNIVRRPNTSQTEDIIYCMAAETPKSEEIPSMEYEKALLPSPEKLRCSEAADQQNRHTPSVLTLSPVVDQHSRSTLSIAAAPTTLSIAAAPTTLSIAAAPTTLSIAAAPTTLSLL